MIKGIRSAEMAYSLALLLTVILMGWISYVKGADEDGALQKAA